MNHTTCNHHCLTSIQIVYVLAFEISDWNAPLIDIEGTIPCDLDARSGVLGVFQTRSLAEHVGEDWARQQLRNRLDDYYDDLETEEEREAALDFWSAGLDGRVDGNWRYSVSSERCECITLEVNEIRVVRHVDGYEEENEEDEEDEDDEAEEREEGEEGEEGEEMEEDDGDESSETDFKAAIESSDLSVEDGK